MMEAVSWECFSCSSVDRKLLMTYSHSYTTCSLTLTSLGFLRLFVRTNLWTLFTKSPWPGLYRMRELQSQKPLTKVSVEELRWLKPLTSKQRLSKKNSKKGVSMLRLMLQWDTLSQIRTLPWNKSEWTKLRISWSCHYIHKTQFQLLALQ